MQRKWPFLSVALGIFLFGCTPPQQEEEPQIQSNVDPREVTRLIHHYAAKISADHQIELKDSALYYGEYINRINLQLETGEIVNLCEGRQLFVDLVEEFLRRMNDNLRLIPQLGRRPFTADQLEIAIVFSSDYGDYVDPYVLGSIEMCRGVVTFYAHDADDLASDRWHARQEYYAQSRDIVQFQREGAAFYQSKELDWWGNPIDGKRSDSSLERRYLGF